MRVGLIARGEDRGLGIQTWEWARHMRPDAVLLVGMGALAGPYPQHRDRFDIAVTTCVEFDGHRFRTPAVVRAWLDSVDVIYCAETWYDDRLPHWCHAAGVRLVCHVNPEFWRWPGEPLPAVRWWLPTSWRRDVLPEGARVVPVPVAIDRWPTGAPRGGPPVFLHVAGKRAAGDRNGTSLLLAALGRTRCAMTVRVVTQDVRLPAARLARGVHLEATTGGVVDYWRLYDDADVLVMPRRYGGLCLPAHEAAGAGLGLAMTAASPNQATWPCAALEVESWTTIHTPAGPVPMANADPAHIARVLDVLAGDVLERQGLAAAARRWAERHSWTTLEPLVRAELERACT